MKTPIAACILAVGLAGADDARAWYFPEHVVLEHEGLMQLPKDVRDVVGEAVGRARKEGLRLCDRVDVPLEDIAQKKTLTTRMIRSEVSVDSVPYSALPALAGDQPTAPRSSGRS